MRVLFIFKVQRVQSEKGKFVDMNALVLIASAMINKEWMKVKHNWIGICAQIPGNWLF